MLQHVMFCLRMNQILSVTVVLGKIMKGDEMIDIICVRKLAISKKCIAALLKGVQKHEKIEHLQFEASAHCSHSIGKE